MIVLSDRRTSAVRVFRENQVLSSAPWNGGFKENVGMIANHTVTTDFNCDVDQCRSYITDYVINPHRMPERSVIMLTAVPQQNMVYGYCDEYVPIACWVTAGISNAVSVGDPAMWNERQEAGTVNTVLLIEAELDPSALVNAFMLVTEAKVKAFYDLGIKSRESEEIATGTGTDCIVVASKKVRRDPFRFTGPHTVFGEKIGRMILGTIKSAIKKNIQSKNNSQLTSRSNKREGLPA